MPSPGSRETDSEREEHTTSSLLKDVSTAVGEEFFRVLVKSLAQELDTHSALVTTFDRENRAVRALAFWQGDEWIEDYQYSIADTPCEAVFEHKELYHYPDHLQGLFPEGHDLPKLGLVSYMGVPLFHPDGSILGNLAVLDRKPMPPEPRFIGMLRLFAARAAAEHQRLTLDNELRAREEKLTRLFNGAVDAMIELDSELRVTQFNPAAERIFGCQACHTIGWQFIDLLEREAVGPFETLLAGLGSSSGDSGHSHWSLASLNAKRGDGSTFVTEASVSRTDASTGPYFTILLREGRNHEAGSQGDAKLREETKKLREAIATIQENGQLVGESPAFREVTRAVARVAPTDSTVLLGGETGTGKEVIARTIHASSRRRSQPLISVNCAAIPANLMESEFFGHEKGAFTGATGKRDGRFANADTGTLFLDEVGEMPLELQGKLLRVLQEGEFEPVGSSVTRKVNVRVIAATNLDLAREVQAGNFREDLYYRLNVFPIVLPALRDRGEDVFLLADCFARQIAPTMDRQFDGLTPDCREQLGSHEWPGNIRELRNVIERSLITSSGGRLDLHGAFHHGVSPKSFHDALASKEGSPGETTRVMTGQEMRELERRNILQALRVCDWKVSGEGGAAKVLEVKPSTLSSRIKALGIERKSI